MTNLSRTVFGVAILLVAGCGAKQRRDDQAAEAAYRKAMIYNLDEVTRTAKEYESAALLFVTQPMNPKNQSLIAQVKQRFDGKVQVVRETSPPPKYADLHKRYLASLERTKSAADIFERSAAARNFTEMGTAGREFAAVQMEINDIVSEFRKRAEKP